MAEQAQTGGQAKGIIAKSVENGLPVIWSFENQLPAADVRTRLPWLITIGWRYDGSSNDGLPDEATKAAIYRLSDGLEPLEDGSASCRAYARTGNSLREWAFYAADQQAFLEALNVALADHETYPIDIKFYEDPDWSDFRNLLADFGFTDAA